MLADGISARLRMDAMTMHAGTDPTLDTEISGESEESLADIWDWCAIKGCRAICLSGRLFMKQGAWSKFR